MGEVFSFMPLVKCKNGRLLRLTDRTQFFYDKHGTVRMATLNSKLAR